MSYDDRQEMTLKEAYRLLDVTESSSLEIIKQSYRRAAKLYHPDTASSLSDTEKFHKVVTAYNIVVSDAKRNQSARAFHGDGTGGWKRFAGKTGSRIMDFMDGVRGRAPIKPVNGNGKAASGATADKKNASQLSFEELSLRFDRSANSWDQIEAAHEVYNRFRPRFEQFAVSRLRRVHEKTLVELIHILGVTGTDNALNAVAPYVMSTDKEVCCAAFMALDEAGAAGHAILDRHINTPSAVMYHLLGFFRKTQIEKHILKNRVMPAERLRRLSAVTRRTGFPMRDLLEGIGVSVSGLA
jgi:curved DNA-binding protein CbpA